MPCVCSFCGMLTTFPLPLLTDCTTRPICRGPDSCCILLCFFLFFFHRNTHALTPPFAICLNLYGAVLSLCFWVNCFVVSASQMPTWPLEATSLKRLRCELTVDIFWHTDTRPCNSPDLEWRSDLCCGSFHTAKDDGHFWHFPLIPCPFHAEGCSHISGYCVSTLAPSHRTSDPQNCRFGKVYLVNVHYCHMGQTSVLENTVHLCIWRVNSSWESKALQWTPLNFLI